MLKKRCRDVISSDMKKWGSEEDKEEFSRSIGLGWLTLKIVVREVEREEDLIEKV